MRIVWNKNEQQFEAQLAQGDAWRNEQAIASGAGFKTDGPPAWVWRTRKAAVVTKLKESRSSLSALSITYEALDAYNRLLAIEQKNAELKAWAKEQKKKLERDEERKQLDALHGDNSEAVEPEYEPSHYYTTPEYWKDKTEITRTDLPADFLARFDKHELIPQRRATSIGNCPICGDVMYYPEGPTCLWCDGKGEEKFLEELL